MSVSNRIYNKVTSKAFEGNSNYCLHNMIISKQTQITLLYTMDINNVNLLVSKQT